MVKDKKLLNYKLCYDSSSDLFILKSDGSCFVSSADFGFVWDFVKKLMKDGHTVDIDYTVRCLSSNRIWGC